VPENTLRSLVRRFKTALGYVPAALYADMRDMLIRDGGPPVTSVAKHKGRIVEIIADEPAANDSSDQFSALDTSNDGGSTDGTDGDVRNAA